MPHSSRVLIILYIVLLLAISSCMFQKKTENAEPTRTASEQYIARGDYKKALDLSATACRNNPEDQGLLANYRRTIEDVRYAADEAFGREDFASSGRAYYVLLKNYPHYQKLNLEVSFDKKFLQARLKNCRSHLSQRALAEYRKGNLVEAISLWKSILAFDPQNAGIKKAINTATIQLKNLKQTRNE
jgi:tetratricopeptide (TPR) repeat protein